MIAFSLLVRTQGLHAAEAKTFEAKTFEATAFEAIAAEAIFPFERIPLKRTMTTEDTDVWSAVCINVYE